jgi:asparagine synthetase B (glutamine-hydrolysing)
LRSHGADIRLGHRRLSIIDLSEAANQPFEKDGWSLVYNGEIYNYQALRRELTSAGVQFWTTSDTEVLLEAWRQWGAASLTRLRGMFAFALLDQRTGRLILGRDPLASSRCSSRAGTAASPSPPNSKCSPWCLATHWSSIRPH